MPLQLRRGPTADRLNITPLAGELVFDTTTKVVYIGDGTTAGGLPVTSFSVADSRTATAKMFLGDSLSDNSIHTGITFAVDGTRLVATVLPDLSNYIGLIKADQGFKGNLWADDSGLIINSETHSVYGNFVPQGHIVPDTNIAYDLGTSTKRFRDIYLSGSSIHLGNAVITSVDTAVNLPLGSTVAGNPLGINEGDTYVIDIQGNVFANDSSIMVNVSTEEFFGKLVGSVYAEDSTLLVDASAGVLRGTLVGDVTGTVTGTLIGNAATASVATTVSLTATDGSSNTHYPVFVDSATGNENIRTDAAFTYQPSTNTLTSQVFSGTTGTFTTVNASTINTTDSSGITVVPSVTFNTTVTVDDDLSVNGDVVPVVSETSSLGTYTKKYQKLYLAEGANALWIGNVAMSVSGSTLDLPAGTTVGGSSIAVSAGGNAITVTVNPSSTNATFYLPFFDGLAGDRTTYIDSNLNYNPSTNTLTTDSFVGNLTGNVTGNVTGNIVGSVVGDLKGSVFADDSTILVDAVSGTIPASVLSGTPTFTNINNNGAYTAYHHTAGSAFISLNASLDNSSGGYTSIRKTRGTQGSPTVVQNGDTIGSYLFQGYDGSAYQTSALITTSVGGAASSGIVPGNWTVQVADASGVLQNRINIAANGAITMGGTITTNSPINITQNSYSSGTPLMAISQYHTTQDATNVNFIRGRGTGSSPSTVLNSDNIIDIGFVAYGTSANVVAGALSVDIDATGTISNTSMPASVSIALNNGTSLATRFKFENSGVIDYTTTTLTGGVGSGQVDTSGAATYIKVKVNGNEYAMPLYNINP